MRETQVRVKKRGGGDGDVAKRACLRPVVIPRSDLAGLLEYLERVNKTQLTGRGKG